VSRVELKDAKLHHPLFVPTLGNVKTSDFSLDSKEYVKPVRMTLIDNLTVECELVNKLGKSETVLVPFSNFINVVVKKDASAKDSKA